VYPSFSPIWMDGMRKSSATDSMSVFGSIYLFTPAKY
jgi:hypothetical protein